MGSAVTTVLHCRIKTSHLLVARVQGFLRWARGVENDRLLWNSSNAMALWFEYGSGLHFTLNVGQPQTIAPTTARCCQRASINPGFQSLQRIPCRPQTWMSRRIASLIAANISVSERTILATVQETLWAEAMFLRRTDVHPFSQYAGTATAFQRQPHPSPAEYALRSLRLRPSAVSRPMLISQGRTQASLSRLQWASVHTISEESAGGGRETHLSSSIERVCLPS